MFALVLVGGSCEHEGNLVALNGIFKSKKHAHDEMVNEAKAMKELWDLEDGEGATNVLDIKEDTASLLDNDVWDHDYWRTWTIFDSDSEDNTRTF